MKVILSPTAVKNFKKIPQNDRVKIQQKINSLVSSPYNGKLLQGQLKDFRSLRAWPYRIIYTIEDNIIIISRILHRQSAYD